MITVHEVRCPDCGSHLDADTCVCPYCCSTAPATAPWQTQMTLPWIAAALVATAGLWIAHQYFGVDVAALFRDGG